MKILPKNQAIMDALRANPAALSVGYKVLAAQHGIGWQNMRRLILQAGLEKVDAKSVKKDALYAAIREDQRNLSLGYEGLMQKHGASRMTVYRALTTAGMSAPKIKVVKPPGRALRNASACELAVKSAANRRQTCAPLPITEAVQIRPETCVTDFSAWLEARAIRYELHFGIYVIPDKNFAVKFAAQTSSISGKTGDNSRENRNDYFYFQRKGTHLLTLWACDWQKRRGAILHWLEHKLGLAKRVCSARQCATGPVDARTAAEFYLSYHLQGPVNGKHFGLHFNGAVVACMTLSKVSPERINAMPDGAFSLVRFATSGSVPGAASKLFKYVVTETKATDVVTFSDNSYAVGGVYDRLGFVMEDEIGPDYRVWHPRYGLRHKSFWQRKSIPIRIKDLGLDMAYDPDTDVRTEFEMCRLIGCEHAWDCGKKRWRWKFIHPQDHMAIPSVIATHVAVSTNPTPPGSWQAFADQMPSAT